MKGLDVAAKEFAQTFLLTLRRLADGLGLKKERLPQWLTCASVRISWIGESIVTVYEDALPGAATDTVVVRGAVGADTVALMNLSDFTPEAASLRARAAVTGMIVLQGSYGAGARTVLNLAGSRPALFDCGFAGYHSPLAICNVFLQHSPADADVGPVSTRFVPFALYLHTDDIASTRPVWKESFQVLKDTIVSIHDSEAGDFYERQQGRAKTLEISKKSSVIVLGSYASSQIEELIQVRDQIRSRGYDAALIRDLPETPEMSNEDKVRLWTISARFCVMVDRVPSGHIAEYMILKEQGSVLALLRPLKSRSTYMIGDEHNIDANYVELFEFEETPLEQLAKAIEWAEKIAHERAKAYEDAYPWRRDRDA